MDVKNQVWSDNLRLPCLAQHDVASILKNLSPPSIPIPFQSKHLPSLKRNVWFALKRPIDRSKTGLLCIIPEKKLCIFVSGDQPSKRFPLPRVAVLNVHLDPQFYETGKPTVMEATLSGRERKLWIEDVSQWKGRILDIRFSERWILAKQWLDHYCIVDVDKLGYSIELAPWSPIVSIKPEGVWELMSDDSKKRRFRWQSRQTYSEPVQVIPPSQTSESLVAMATRASGPDQWELTSSDSVSLGRALIRSLKMSTALRGCANVTRIEVKWQPAFKKWEAIKISQEPTSTNEFFESHKVE